MPRRKTTQSEQKGAIQQEEEHSEEENEEEVTNERETFVRRSKRRKLNDTTGNSEELAETGFPGWDAINKALATVYGPRHPDAHFLTLIPWSLGGPDPLRGVSVFAVPAGETSNEPAHWHYVTFGFSELLESDSPNKDISGFGFELTFRLKRTEEDIAEEMKIVKRNKGKRYQNDVAGIVPVWPVNFLNNLARYVYGTGRGFRANDRMHLNGTIYANAQTSSIVAIVFTPDATLPARIDTPNGTVDFLQVVGLTNDEYELTWEWSTNGLAQFIKQNNPFLVTDIYRKSILEDKAIAAAIRERIDLEGSKQRVIFSSVEFFWEGPGKLSNEEMEKKSSKTKNKSSETTQMTQKTNSSAEVTEYHITVGAAMIEHFVTVLRYRLPYNRDLKVIGHTDDIVTFIPADGIEDEAEGGSKPKTRTPSERSKEILKCEVVEDPPGYQTLQIVLSNDKVIELCELLKPVKGTYTISSETEPRVKLIIEVKPTTVLSSTGDKVVKVVGNTTENK